MLLHSVYRYTHQANDQTKDTAALLSEPLRDVFPY